MSTLKTIIATLLVAFTFESINLVANENDVKLAALILYKQENSLIKIVNFENTIPSLLKLKDEFTNNPQYLESFLRHFDFMINDQAIPVNESKTFMVRKDKPFTFTIKAKRGKLESLLAYMKTTTQDWLQTIYSKAANFLTLSISFDAPLHDYFIDKGTIHLDELICHHPKMREIFENPTKIMEIIGPYLSWDEWFGVVAKLPELKYQDFHNF